MIKRKLLAPLASAFILPGVGQIINRQPAKAVALILVSGLTFAVGLFFALKELNRAISIPAVYNAPEGQKWKALSDQLFSQGIDWIMILLAVWAAIWCYGVVDAFIWGKRWDQIPKEQD